MDAKIYGHNHSPWVQAVLLGLHEKKIKYTLYQTPPFEILKIWGVYMPAAALDGNSWEVESSKILKKLDSMKFLNKISELLRMHGRAFYTAPIIPLNFFQHGLMLVT